MSLCLDIDDAPIVQIKKSVPVRWTLHDAERQAILARSTVEVVVVGRTVYSVVKTSTGPVLASGVASHITYEWDRGLLPSPATDFTTKLPYSYSLSPGGMVTLSWEQALLIFR